MKPDSWRQICLEQVYQRTQKCGLSDYPTIANRAKIWLAWGAIATLLIGGGILRSSAMLNASVPDVIELDPVNQPKATAQSRVVQKNEQQRQIRSENYDLSQFPVIDKNAKHWRNLLWTTAVVQPKEAFVADGLQQVLALMQRSGLSKAQQRIIDLGAKTATQLYVNDPSFYQVLGQQFLQAVNASPDPEWVAVSLSALARAGLPASDLTPLAQQVKRRFPGWSRNLPLMTTLREIEDSLTAQPSPPLEDLLGWQVAPNQIQLYVLCQRDRYVLCRAVLKDRKGNFVRHSNGTLWSVPLLLKSLHDLGWNFERGQTPQGIYRMEGVRPQPDDEFFRAYGHFSLVNMFLPFEEGAKEFIPGKAGSFKGSLADYTKLLPPSWRQTWGMQQSFWAGKIGRSDFRVHGSGEAPDFFPGKEKYGDSYSWNPTIGCLSALELYNEQGKLVAADMPKILTALRIVGGPRFAGYIIVAELPNSARQPISVKEIEQAIRLAKANPSQPADLAPKAMLTR